MLGRFLTLFIVLICGSAYGKVNVAKKMRNMQHERIANQIFVKFVNVFDVKANRELIEPLGGEFDHLFEASLAFLITFPSLEDAVELDKISLKIATSPLVEYVEANTIVSAVSLPNDPKFSKLYGMHNTGQSGGSADADIDAPEAWKTSTGSHSVLVGVIDSGVNYLHPDLQANYWRNPGETGLDAQGKNKNTNGIDDDGNGFIDDWRGWDFANGDNDPMDDNSYMHGTHCAGTIGAVGNNGRGVAGVNWNVSIVGLKFLGQSGSGALADAIKAVEYATNLGVNITNNSWGGGGYSQVMAAALSAAEAKSILFVAAAGNSAVDNDADPHYPSSYPHASVIAVAATDHGDRLAGFSNYGRGTVDIAAPGVDIVSTGRGSEYHVLSGTSMATPHVVGAAALIEAVFPGISYVEMRRRLLSGAERNSGLQGKVATAARLNVARSIELDLIKPAAVSEVEVIGAERNSVTLRWKDSGDDGADGSAGSYQIRYANAPIGSEEDWQAAKVPELDYTTGAGFLEGTISNLAFNYKGYACVRAVDNVGNISDVGVNVPIAVSEIKVLYQNDASTLAGVSVESPWNVETMAEGRLVFSDSPRESYKDNTSASLTLPSFALGTSALSLVYTTAFAIEKGYDFGFVELSRNNGATWVKVDQVSDSKGWHKRVINLEPYIGAEDQFQLRFRFSSDYMITGEGWWVDSLALLGDR